MSYLKRLLESEPSLIETGLDLIEDQLINDKDNEIILCTPIDQNTILIKQHDNGISAEDLKNILPPSLNFLLKQELERLENFRRTLLDLRYGNLRNTITQRLVSQSTSSNWSGVKKRTWSEK